MVLNLILLHFLVLPVGDGDLAVAIHSRGETGVEILVPHPEIETFLHLTLNFQPSSIRMASWANFFSRAIAFSFATSTLLILLTSG